MNNLSKAFILIRQSIDSSRRSGRDNNNSFFIGFTFISLLGVSKSSNIYDFCLIPFIYKGTLFCTLSLSLLIKMNHFILNNLYKETKRAQNRLLYEPKNSGKMIFFPLLGLYFIDYRHINKHKFNII